MLEPPPQQTTLKNLSGLTKPKFVTYAKPDVLQEVQLHLINMSPGLWVS